MSKRISRAGVSCDSRRIRLAAGCNRACNASKVMRPFSSMTSSPSTTNRSNGTSSSVATTSGKKRPSDVPDFPLISTAPPSLKARQRKPSHFGSNCHFPGSFGSDSADFASMGAAAARINQRPRRRASFERSSANLHVLKPAAYVAQRAHDQLGSAARIQSPGTALSDPSLIRSRPVRRRRQMTPRESEPQKETVERVMHEFKHGELRSGTSGRQGQKSQAGDGDRSQRGRRVQSADAKRERGASPPYEGEGASRRDGEG